MIHVAAGASHKGAAASANTLQAGQAQRIYDSGKIEGEATIPLFIRDYQT